MFELYNEQYFLFAWLIIRWCSLISPAEEKQENEGYYHIHNVIGSTHTDNLEVFLELIHTKDDQPLFNGVTKKKVCF